MKKITVFIVLLATSISSLKAQYVKDQLATDQQNRSLYTSDNLREEGSPLFAVNWLSGLVKFTNGATFKSDFLKYDLEKDQLYFKDTKSDELLLFALPVSEFSLSQGDKNWYFKSGYAAVDRNKNSSFYQVLVNGTVQLTKRIVKQAFDERAYNSATTTRSYKEDEYYYLVRNNIPTKIKKDKKQILLVLTDKATELDSYCKEQALNLKNEGDLAKLIVYYNSLL